MTSEDNPTAEASSSALDAVNPHQLFVDYPFSSDQSYQVCLTYSIHFEKTDSPRKGRVSFHPCQW